jgi:putative Mg2+ transporter-C (MgtC) family protein
MTLAFLLSWDQHIRDWATSLGAPTEDLIRMALAVIAGGLVGLEREVRGRQAGFRTYILVCLGSAVVMIVSMELALHRWSPQGVAGVNINVDPGRIAYGVMTGVGFLGAGVIVQNHRGVVHGLTTAAGLWCIAGVGLAAGFGMYVTTILATLCILATLWLFDYFENLLPKMRYRTVTVRTHWQPGCVAATVERFARGGVRVVSASFDRTPDLTDVDVHVHVGFLDLDRYHNLQRDFENDPQYELISTREV